MFHTTRLTLMQVQNFFHLHPIAFNFHNYFVFFFLTDRHNIHLNLICIFIHSDLRLLQLYICIENELRQGYITQLAIQYLE